MLFELKIDYIRSMGESETAQRAHVAQLLHQAANELARGAGATPLRYGGEVCGSYEFTPVVRS